MTANAVIAGTFADLRSCSICALALPWSEFHKHPRGRDGLFTYCKSCHRNKTRARKRAMAAQKRRPSTEERFWSMVIPEPNSGCWLWVGALSGKSYGAFRPGAGEASVKAHRWSYEHHFAPIPDGLHVCHKCDTPICVNPDHLFLGTPVDNARDRENKGRGNQPRGDKHPRRLMPWICQRGNNHPSRRIDGWGRGTRNGRAKLNEQDVREIRASGSGCYRLSKKYGVSTTTIKKIRNGILWSHVQ